MEAGMALSQRKKLRLFEVILWHGVGKEGCKKWITDEDPELLDNGMIRFRCQDGFQHILIGNVEVTQIPNRATRAKPRSE